MVGDCGPLAHSAVPRPAGAPFGERHVTVDRRLPGEHRHKTAAELDMAQFGLCQLAHGGEEVDHLDEAVAYLSLCDAWTCDHQWISPLTRVVESGRPLLDKSVVAEVFAVVGEEAGQHPVLPDSPMPGSQP